MHRFSAENLESLREVARQAIDYCQKDSNLRCELECEGIVISVCVLDTPSKVVEKWKTDLDFFGLTTEDRWKIYDLYIVQGLPATTVSKRARLSSNTVAKYIRAKGWARSYRELREKQSNSGDIRKDLDSWDASHLSGWARQEKGVKDPYECYRQS